jgi:hypothetical protein
MRGDRGGGLTAMLSRRSLLAAAATLAAGPARAEDAAVRVASKADVEGALLGSLILRSLRAGGVKVADQLGLGGTRIVRAALVAGEIDLYPEYTGNGAFFFHQENEPIWRDRLGGWARIRILDRSRNHLVWLPAAPRRQRLGDRDAPGHGGHRGSAHDDRLRPLGERRRAGDAGGLGGVRRKPRRAAGVRGRL